MKRIVFETYGKVIACILTMAGFSSSCDITSPSEYGVPSADYVVKGTVIDKSTRQPIKNMSVINKSEYSPYGNDTTRTDTDGNYELQFTQFPIGKGELTIYTSDTDGAENGAYRSDTIRIKAENLRKIAKGRGSWYRGKFEGSAHFEIEYTTDAMYGVPSAEYKEMRK